MESVARGDVASKQASAVVVGRRVDAPEGLNLLRVADPYAAITRPIVRMHGQRSHPQWGVSESAVVSDGAWIGARANIAPQVTIADDVEIGDDAMIARAGELARSGGWTLVKVAKPNQDMRFDVPTVGADTIENLHRAGGRILVVEAGKTLLIDRDKTVELANRRGIAVVGRADVASAADA